METKGSEEQRPRSFSEQGITGECMAQLSGVLGSHWLCVPGLSLTATMRKWFDLTLKPQLSHLVKGEIKFSTMPGTNKNNNLKNDILLTTIFHLAILQSMHLWGVKYCFVPMKKAKPYCKQASFFFNAEVICIKWGESQSILTLTGVVPNSAMMKPNSP